MYLEAIEADQPARLPGDFFYKSFVRQYAQALQLNPDRFIFEEPQPEPVPQQPEIRKQQKPARKTQPVRDRDQYVKLIDSSSLNERRVLTTFFALMCVLAGGAMVYSWTQPSIERASTVNSSTAPVTQR